MAVRAREQRSEPLQVGHDRARISHTVPGGHGFSTTLNPIPPTATPFAFQFRYDTNAGAGRGAPLTGVRIRLRDENGDLLGEQDVSLP